MIVDFNHQFNNLMEAEDVLPVCYQYNPNFHQLDLIDFNPYLTNKYGHTVTMVNDLCCVLLFGVYINTNKDNALKTFSSNTVIYNFENNSMLVLEPIKNLAPCKRAAHAACKGYDNHLFLYGGTKENNIFCSNELWHMEITQGVFCQWDIIRTAGDAPCLRYGHTMNYLKSNDRLILFGGIDQSGNVLNDLWLIDLSNINGRPSLIIQHYWKKINTELRPDIPSSNFSRAYHTSSEINNSIFIFGGRLKGKQDIDSTMLLRQNSLVIETNEYNKNNISISQYSDSIYQDRQFHSAVFLCSIIFLIGGQNVNKQEPNDNLVAYNINTEKWYILGLISIKRHSSVLILNITETDFYLSLYLIGGIEKKYHKIHKENANLTNLPKTQMKIKKTQKKENILSKGGIIKLDLKKYISNIPELYFELNNIVQLKIKNMTLQHSLSIDIKKTSKLNTTDDYRISNNILRPSNVSFNISHNDQRDSGFKFAPKLFAYKMTNELEEDSNILNIFASNRNTYDSLNLFARNTGKSDIEVQVSNERDYNNIKNNIKVDYFSTQIIDKDLSNQENKQIELFKNISLDKLGNESKKLTQNSSSVQNINQKRVFNEDLVDDYLRILLPLNNSPFESKDDYVDNYNEIITKEDSKTINLKSLNELLSYLLENKLHLLNKKEKTKKKIVNLKYPIKIFSNIKGNYNLLLSYFNFYGRPSQLKGDIETFDYLFLGNNFNEEKGGIQNLKLLSLMICLIIKYPKNITFLRSKEVDVKLPPFLYSMEFNNISNNDKIEHEKRIFEFKLQINKLFTSLPLVSIISDKICCLYSGIPNNLQNFSENEIFYKVPNKENVLFDKSKISSDNNSMFTYFDLNLFLLEYKLQFIIRSEQGSLPQGFNKAFDGKMISFNSNTGNNSTDDGCFIIIKKNGELKFKIIKCEELELMTTNSQNLLQKIQSKINSDGCLNNESPTFANVLRKSSMDDK